MPINPFGFLSPEQAAQAAAAVAAAGGQPSYEGSVPLTPAPTNSYSELQNRGAEAGGNQTEPPALEQAPAQTGMSDDASEGDIASMAVKDAIVQNLGEGVTPKPAIVHGANYAAVGGERGQERFNTAIDAAPALQAQGIAEGADAADKEATELTNYYDTQRQKLADEAAVMQSNRQAHEAAAMQRQQEIDEKTAAYSKNLSDNGAYWKNPGNILSAIAFALMPFGANDPNIGIKTLGAAIQQDLENRRELAKGHLGALRSNLEGYKKIAGDAEAGDLLAQQDAYRVAAAEVARIASKYQGPKAQAAAKAIIGELGTKVNLLGMELYQKYIYNRPQALPDPIAKAYQSGPGYQNFMPQAPQVPTAAPAGKAVTGGGAAAISRPAGGGASAMSSGQVGKAAAATAGQAGDSFEKIFGRDAAKQLDASSPGLRAVFPHLLQHIKTQAKAQLGPKATPDAIRKYAAEYITKTQTDINDASKRNDPLVKENTGWAYMQADMNEIHQFFHGDKQKIQEFLGALNSNAPGAATRWDQFWTSLGYGGAEPTQKGRVQAAATRFRQVMTDKISNYYHSRAGAALSDSEKAILNQVISPTSTWDQMQEFVRQRSSESASQFLNTFAGSNELARHLWNIRMAKTHLGYSSLDSEGKRQDRSTKQPAPVQKPGEKKKEPEPTKGLENFDYSTIKG